MQTHHFHEGEVALQRSVGMADKMAPVAAQVIRDHMPLQHRDFYPLLPYLIVGSQGPRRQIWASVLSGPIGFVQSPTETQLCVHSLPRAGDPLADTLQTGQALGLLGLQAHTRRRNRANGVVHRRGAADWALTVKESFGNCPKYIHPREAFYVPPAHGSPSIAPPVKILTHLDARTTALLRQADTAFIASAHPDAGVSHNAAHGVDVSHRAGPAGFISVQGDTLFMPDYRGNFFFNTLGNLHLNAFAGLTVMDYAHGHLLQLSGRVEIVTHPDASLAHETPRGLRIWVDEARWHEQAVPLRWQDHATESQLTRG